MIAALATIAFLAAAWAALVAIAGSFEHSLGKINAALRGNVIASPKPIALRISPRYPQARSQSAQPLPALRAAA